MTHDELTSRYTLLEQLTAGGVKSFQARHAATHRPVMVHFIDGDASETQMRVIGSLEQLDRADRDTLIEMLDVDGATVIVTPVLDGFESFELWLGARSATRKPRPSAGSLTSVLEPSSTAAAKPPAPPRSDYTMIVGSAPQTAPPSQPAAAAPPPSARPAAPDPIASDLARLEERLKSYMQLVVLLNLVVSAAVVLLLYFLLK